MAQVKADNYYFLHAEEAPLLILQGEDINPVLHERFAEKLVDLFGEPQAGIRCRNRTVRSGENG